MAKTEAMPIEATMLRQANARHRAAFAVRLALCETFEFLSNGSSSFQTAGRNPEFLFFKFGSTEQKCRPLRVC